MAVMSAPSHPDMQRAGPGWRLPRPRLRHGAIDGWPLDAAVKGVPVGLGALTLRDAGGRGLNLHAGDLPLPAAVIRRDAMLANSAWMKRFLALNALEIAPHGKTTMAPQLFALQLEEGAWAITVATSQQLMVAKAFGVPRVIYANQPTGRAAIDACFAAISGSDGLDLIVLADSVAVVEALAAGARRAKSGASLEMPAASPGVPAASPGVPGASLGVLVEMGAAGGRTGARTFAEGMAVARAVAASPGLALRGFECFEGVLGSVAEVDRLLDSVLDVAESACAAGLVDAGGEVVLSAGGTAYFDRVGERFREAGLGGRKRLVVIRSGCYLTHDDIGYDAAYRRILAETALKLPEGRLTAALEVWASVQSRPEPNKTLLTMGKRDVSYDAGMPVPLRWMRPGLHGKPQPMPRGHVVTALNDQHAHMGTPGESPLAVGDMVGFGIGHPCTTFDKWQLIWIVDDDGAVVDAIRTFF